MNDAVNWPSLVGVLLILFAVPGAVSAGFEVMFIIARRADPSPGLLLHTFHRLVVALGRLLGLPLAGAILFLQGWRLDPILQLAVFILAAGVLIEASGGFAEDLGRWRRGRNGQGGSGDPLDHPSAP